MKVVLMFTLCLISGPVGCFEVTGYSGGAVEIYCTKQGPKRFDTFCKDGEKQCVYLKHAQTQDTWDHNDRVYLHEVGGDLRIIFRALSVQDTGSYQCGDTGFGSQDIELEVKTDPCCPGPKTETGYLGETVTISCPYPEGFGEKKFFVKLDGHILIEVIRTGSNPDHSIGGRVGDRFSISDNRESRVVSMRITDVREDDAGVYFCGAVKKDDLFKYETFFSEVQLQVTDLSARHSLVIIIPVCVCVTLLLTGGSALIYKLRRKTETQQADGDYENDLPGNRNNTSMSPVYQSLNPNTNQTDSAYQSLNPNTNQSDSVYRSLNPNTNQSDSVYQSLNPNTNQSDSAYQSLNPKTNQSDSVYQSLNPNTNQSDSVYHSLHPYANQSDSVYQSLNPNTNQSDSVYHSLHPYAN